MSDLYTLVAAAIPKQLQDASSDLVSWTAIGDRGYEVGKWKYYSCYALAMSQLAQLEVYCRPYPRGAQVYPVNEDKVINKDMRKVGRFSGLQYLRFMRSLQKVGIAPEGAKFFVDKEHGNCLTVPKGLDRHTVYTLLALYRYQDTYPTTLWRTALIQRHLRRNGIPLPFLQALFYVMTRHGFMNGHSPINFSQNDLSLGWAWAFFNQLPQGKREELTPKTDTMSMFRDLAQTIRTTGLPKLKTESFLLPAYSPLFTEPEKFTKESYANLLKENKDATLGG